MLRALRRARTPASRFRLSFSAGLVMASKRQNTERFRIAAEALVHLGLYLVAQSDESIAAADAVRGGSK
jgi:hypothetical protein